MPGEGYKLREKLIPSLNWQKSGRIFVIIFLHSHHLFLTRRRFCAPDSESFESFIDRAHAFIARLRDTTGENVAVFSHEQFITAVLWLIGRGSVDISSQTMGEFRDYFRQSRIPNGAIVHLKARPGQDSWPRELITEHLGLLAVSD